MREAFRHELDHLADQLVQMSELVTQAINLANKAILTADIDLAEQVIDADVAIDNLQTELDQNAIDILATQAPVAGDLRVVVSALRMSAPIERMGDLARHIAQQARIRYPEQVIPDTFRATFEGMARSSERIANATQQLLSHPGLSEVPNIAAIDEELDNLHLAVFNKIAEEPDLKSSTIADVTLLSRYYERFGDHAESIAQKVEFLLTGNWDHREAQQS